MSVASHHAKILLGQMGITSVPINPYDISEKIGIEVKEDDCEGYTGMLLVIGEEALISIKSSIREYSRKRFTVAHELAHYKIPEHLAGGKSIFKCTENDLNTFDKKGNKESEANEFAAELLMPEDAFRGRIKHKSLSLDLLQELTSVFETSLTATGIRYTMLDEDCALICSENSYIKWFVKGDEFPFYVRAKGRLDEESMATEFFKGTVLPRSFEVVPASAWVDDYRLKDYMKCRELSIALPSYNQVLSFLRMDSYEETEEDEALLDELDGYPKFRR